MLKQISTVFLFSVLASASSAADCESFLLVLKTDASNETITRGCAAMGIAGTATITSCDGKTATFKSPSHTDRTTAQFDLVARPRIGDFHFASSDSDLTMGFSEDTFVSLNLLDLKFQIVKNTKISRTHAANNLVCGGTLQAFPQQ